MSVEGGPVHLASYTASDNGVADAAQAMSNCASKLMIYKAERM